MKGNCERFRFGVLFAIFISAVGLLAIGSAKLSASVTVSALNGQEKGGRTKPTPTPLAKAATSGQRGSTYPKTRHKNPTATSGGVKPGAAVTGTPGMKLAAIHAGNEGTISGEVAYVGPAPRQLRIDTSADLVCSDESPNLMDERYVVRRGNLANVFVYIKDGTTDYGQKLRDLSFEAPTRKVVLDQKGCRFVPHVLGLQVNQKLEITNSDPTQHNIHPTPRNNPEWNQTQPNGAPPIEKSFGRAEVLIPVKCNQHPWMRAYVGVLSHPFYAVSKPDGSFAILGVPPGTYTLAAWHEGGAFGTEETIQVTVNPQTTSSVSFRFGMATAAGRRPSLEMLPAIELLMSGKSGLHQH